MNGKREFIVRSERSALESGSDQTGAKANVSSELFQTLIPAWCVYFIAVISPGPATLAISGTAMTHGRSAGTALATGVLTGSMIWALLAGLGVSALLSQFAYALVTLKFLGGLYLLWLGWKSFCSASRKDAGIAAPADQPAASRKAFYLKGLGIHLTNPKAIFVWLSLVSLGLPAHAPAETVRIFIAGAAVIGFLTFNAIAILFSTSAMMRGYKRSRRAIETVLGAFFTLAGLRLLTTRF